MTQVNVDCKSKNPIVFCKDMNKGDYGILQNGSFKGDLILRVYDSVTTQPFDFWNFRAGTGINPQFVHDYYCIPVKKVNITVEN